MSKSGDLAIEAARLAYRHAGGDHQIGMKVLYGVEMKVIRGFIQEMLSQRGGEAGDVLYWQAVVDEMKR